MIGSTVKQQVNPEKIKHVYGTKLCFKQGNVETKIHYKTSIVFLEYATENTYILEVNRDQVYINGKTPDIVAEELADICGAVLFPLQIEVTKQYNVLQIANHAEIQERWQQAKQDIATTFAGEEVDLYLQKMTDSIMNYKLLYTLLFEDDWFFLLLFNFFKKQNNRTFPILPYGKSINFSVVNSTSYHSIRKEDIVLTKQCICIDEREEQDVRDGLFVLTNVAENKLVGEGAVTYHFFKNSPVVNTVIANFDMVFPSGKEMAIAIETHHLQYEKAENTEAIEEKEMEKIKEETKEKKKKRRYFLFGTELKL